MIKAVLERRRGHTGCESRARRHAGIDMEMGTAVGEMLSCRVRRSLRPDFHVCTVCLQDVCRPGVWVVHLVSVPICISAFFFFLTEKLRKLVSNFMSIYTRHICLNDYRTACDVQEC